MARTGGPAHGEAERVPPTAGLDAGGKGPEGFGAMVARGGGAMEFVKVLRMKVGGEVEEVRDALPAGSAEEVGRAVAEALAGGGLEPGERLVVVGDG